MFLSELWIWNECFKTETFHELYYFDNEFNWSTNQLTEIQNPAFKPEVIVTNSVTQVTNVSNSSLHDLVQNSQKYSSSRNENSGTANAQLYFNLKKIHEIEIHCLRCIFLENFVPFNSIFTSSGDDSLDNSEQYIFIRNWNLICPCWRLQDPYENGIIRKTFVTFEKIDEFPSKPFILNETRTVFPYQEFKKVQKSVPLQFQLPASKTVPITEMYSSRSIESIKTTFKYPKPTDHLATIIPIDNTVKLGLLQYKKDFSSTQIKIPLIYNMGIAEESNSSAYQAQKLEIITNKKFVLEKDPQDSVISFQRIPGTVSDNLYEKDNTELKSKKLPKSMNDVTCTSSTEFSNSNLMLVENTLVAVNSIMNHDETSLLTTPTNCDRESNPNINSPRPTTSSGWASQVNFSVPTASDDRESTDDVNSSVPTTSYDRESIDDVNYSVPTVSSRASNIKVISSATSSGWASNVNFNSSVSTVSDWVSNDEGSSSVPTTHSVWVSNVDISNSRSSLSRVDGDDDCRLLSAESTGKEVNIDKSKENIENEILEAIPEQIITNGNNKSIVPSKTHATKHKLMFSWLKKHPIRQSMMMKYLFRGIGFGIASIGVKPKRIGHTTGESSMKRKIMPFKFKNRFAVPNKVVPIDPMSFRKSVVHEKIFKKRTIRKNHKSHKIIQNFEVQRILPAKILRHNRVIPLPKFTEPKK